MSTAAGTPSAGGVEDTVKDFWTSRPRRSRRGRKIAGVAAGVGHRYNIDPVIVRVALIVATVLGGFGVLLYLLAWLFLPDERDEVSAAEALFGKGRSSTPTHITVGLCIALFPAAGWAFGDWWFQGTGWAMTALLLIGLFVLHRSRGNLNRPTTRVPSSSTAPASFSAQQTSLSAEESSESTYQPPAGVWDPLGAAPLGWNLPGEDPAALSESQPSGQPPAPRRRSFGSGLVVGAALVTGGLGLTLAMLDVPWFTTAHVIGMTLAVLGIGMVFSSFAGNGRGLLALAVPLSAAGLLFSVLPATGLPGGGFGEVNAKPANAAAVQSLYQRTAGSVSLDLTELTADSDAVTTKVEVGMGEAVVIVPPAADVTYTCEVSAGQIDCLGKTADGMGLDALSGKHLGADGAGGPQIKLDVSSAMGTVEVRRGR